MNRKPLFLLRIMGVVLVMVVGLGSSWGTIRPVLAEVPAQVSSPGDGATPVPVEATLGEPAEINPAPKQGGEAAQPDDKLVPSLDSPPAPPDGPKESHPDLAPERPDSIWTLMMSETFEGVFPNTLWQVIDGNGTTYGEYYWDDDDYKPHAGSWSAWPANGGANALDPAVYYYPNNMDSWMLYGPFDLSNCADADFDF